MLGYLETQDGFIQLSQEDYNPDFENWVSLPNGVKLRLLDSGVLEMPDMRDYIGASSYILSNNYYNSRDQFHEVVDEGFEAILGAIEKKELLLEMLL